MAKYNVYITQTAENDLKSIVEYISTDSIAAANRWADEIAGQINSLETFPMRFQIIPEAPYLGKQYRHLIYGNYRTIYKINQSAVTILRVINTAQLLNI